MRLSVVMCTYNGARYVGEQLESIGAQRRRPDELIVHDDGSIDDTVEIVSAFATRAPFPVTVWVNPARLGVIANFGGAVAAATGDWIALADQDDVWHADKLERLEQAITEHPEAGLVFSDAVVIDDEGRDTGRRLWSEVGFNHAGQRTLAGRRAVDLLICGATVTGATAIFHSSWRSAALPFPEDLPFLHDAWLALVIGLVTPLVMVETPLIDYRLHAGQHTGITPAPPDRQPASTWTEGLSRRTEYAAVIDVLERVASRLDQGRDLGSRERALRGVKDQLVHLRLRESLSKWPRVARVPAVVRELVTGRYHRYGRGVLSAAKDVVR